MKISRYAATLLGTALLALVASFGCRDSAQTHTVKKPVQAQSEEANLPLEITVKSPEVPENIRRPSPPIDPKTAK